MRPHSEWVTSAGGITLSRILSILDFELLILHLTSSETPTSSMEQETLHDGRIVRSEDPLNLEMPFSSMDQFITPTKSFYVRTHFPIPAIDKDEWWLHVEGEV